MSSMSENYRKEIEEKGDDKMRPLEIDKEKENRLLDTHCELQALYDSLVDKPYNKKMKKMLLELSAYFRYKWEQEKAENSKKYWQEASRQMFLRIRDETLNSKRKQKKK